MLRAIDLGTLPQRSSITNPRIVGGPKKGEASNLN